MFLASQLYEEVKHAEFFERYFLETSGKLDTSAYLNPLYRGVLLDELKERGQQLGRALCDGRQDELGLARALFATQYFGVIEGMMAVTGYDFFEDLLAKTNMFPRLLEGIRLIRADEGRHIAHGMDYIREMITQHPEYAAPVRELFMKQAASIPARNEFVFTPNGLGLDPQRMMGISQQHLQQRLREAGLS
jgi:ribonucleoside-diphosphate reductase beta chain